MAGIHLRRFHLDFVPRLGCLLARTWRCRRAGFGECGATDRGWWQELDRACRRSRPTSPAKTKFSEASALPSPRPKSASAKSPSTSSVFAAELSKAMLSIETNHSPVIRQHPHHKWANSEPGWLAPVDESEKPRSSLRPQTPSPRASRQASPVPFADNAPDYTQVSPNSRPPPPYSAAATAAASSRVYGAHSSRRTHAFFSSQPFWLGLYFVFNLSLTLYNKVCPGPLRLSLLIMCRWSSLDSPSRGH